MSVLPHNARRNLIVLSVERKGKTEEGQLENGHAAILPGTWVEVVPGSAKNGQGRFTWRAFQPGANPPGMVGILEEDKHQGKAAEDLTTPANVQYVGDDHIFIYIPQRGDHLNMLVTLGANPLNTSMQPNSGTGIGEVAVVGNDYPKVALREDGAGAGAELREVEVL